MQRDFPVAQNDAPSTSASEIGLDEQTNDFFPPNKCPRRNAVAKCETQSEEMLKIKNFESCFAANTKPASLFTFLFYFRLSTSSLMAYNIFVGFCEWPRPLGKFGEEFFIYCEDFTSAELFVANVCQFCLHEESMIASKLCEDYFFAILTKIFVRTKSIA